MKAPSIRELLLPSLAEWESTGSGPRVDQEEFIACAEEIARHSGREEAWKWVRAYRQAWHDHCRAIPTPWPAHQVLERMQEERKWRVS